MKNPSIISIPVSKSDLPNQQQDDKRDNNSQSNNSGGGMFGPILIGGTAVASYYNYDWILEFLA